MKIIACYLLFVVLFLSGCVESKSRQYDYKVLSLADIEKSLYAKLEAQGVVEKVKDTANKYTVKNVEVAKSQNSMPLVLNELGSEGWALSAINQSQLYIFKRTSPPKKNRKKWEYKVLTASDVKKLVVTSLLEENAVKAVEDQKGKYSITSVDKAKSQVVMPKVFDILGQKGWELSAVNKAQLYIFRRELRS